VILQSAQRIILQSSRAKTRASKKYKKRSAKPEKNALRLGKCCKRVEGEIKKNANVCEVAKVRREDEGEEGSQV